MALFQQKEKNKLFKVIDGNKIVRDNRERNAQPGSYGMIRNNKTGETATASSNTKPESYIAPQEQQSNQRDTTYDNDLMEQDEGYANYAQAYEYELGQTPSYQQYQDYMAAGGDEQPQQEQLSEEEVQATQDDYGKTMGKIGDYMKQMDIPINEVYNQLPGEISEDAIDKAFDPSKIKNFDDMVEAGTVIDYIVDILDLDTHKFFGTGEVEPCGEECQKRRAAAREKHASN